jgi:RNA:NAD 2'-phosphotransferase (TPT1/KptA family)
VDLNEERRADIVNILDSVGKYGNTIGIKITYELIANQQKTRFETNDNRIRALHGHPTAIKKGTQ